MSDINNKKVLILAPPNGGKTASLRNFEKLEGRTLIINMDAKGLPFTYDPTKIEVVVPESPLDIPAIIDAGEKEPTITRIVFDTITMAASKYATLFVADAADGRAAWGAYAQFLRHILEVQMSRSTKTFIVIAHETNQLNEATGKYDFGTSIQGGMAKTGIEQYFTVIVGAKAIQPSLLPEHVVNDLLDLDTPAVEGFPSPRDLDLAYVYQTSMDKTTVGAKYRAPMGFWKPNELFIDNDIVHVVNRVDEFYG